MKPEDIDCMITTDENGDITQRLSVRHDMKPPVMPEPYLEPCEWESNDSYSKGDIVKYQPQPSGWWRAVEWCRTRIFRKPHRDVPTYTYMVVEDNGWSVNPPPPDNPEGWEPVDEVEQFTWESDSDGFREVVSLIDNNLPPRVSMTNYYLLRFASGELKSRWALYEEIDRCCQSRLIEIGKIDNLKRTCINLYSKEKQA